VALKLYSKLDSAADVVSPQIGVGGSIFGSPTFIPCKYNNGIYANTNPTSLDGCSFDTTTNEINIDEGKIEIWVKLKFNSSQGGAHVVWDFRRYDEGAYKEGIYLDFVFSSGSLSRLRVICFFSDGNTKAWSEPFAFSIDDLMHLKVVWERTGTKIPDGKTLVLYKNEVEMDHSHTIWDATPNICPFLHLRSREPGSPHPPRMVEDDLRAYNDWEGIEVVADFSGTPTSGYAPLTVQFTDLSTNTPTSWLWNFGDGKTSREQNPSHIYDDVGIYTVTLTATNATGSDDEVKVNYITVLAPPIGANFSAQPLTGKYPLVVQFTDLSTGEPLPTSWLWDFGDREISEEQNPTHIYKEAGLYTVSLTAANEAGSDTETKFGYIEAIERSFIEKRGIEERQQMKIRHISLKRGLAIEERIPIRVLEPMRDPPPKRVWR